MDFNEALKLLREGQSPERIINNWWRDLAKENNIGEDTAKELAARQVATAQQVIAQQDKGMPEIAGQEILTERGENEEATSQRGGGGVIYRDFDAIMALTEGARPYAGEQQEVDIKADLADGRGWNPVLGRWYTKEEYLDDISKLNKPAPSPTGKIMNDALSNWNNDKAVSININKIVRTMLPDKYELQKITDLPSGDAPTVAGQAVTVAPTDTTTTTVTPSAAAKAAGAAGAAATKDAAQPSASGSDNVGGLIGTGLDQAKLAKLGVTPSQMARALPTMLPGGTSPFVARGYSNILQNYTEIFPMMMIAGAVPGFGLGQEISAGMLDESNMSNLANPQAFAAFIKQKPEKIAQDIKTTLALLESAKAANEADKNWAFNNSTTQSGLLLEFFTKNPDQYNQIGGKELALRQTLGKMGQPKWLGDLISNQLQKKYTQQLLIDPDAIATAGFYNNAFSNFTTPNPELTKEVINAGTPAAQAGASKTQEQIKEEQNLKPFIPGVESGEIDMDIQSGSLGFNPTATPTATAPTVAATPTADAAARAGATAKAAYTMNDPRINLMSNIDTGQDNETYPSGGLSGTTLDDDKDSPTYGKMVTYVDGIKTSAYQIDMQTGQKFMFEPTTGQLSGEQSGRIDPNTGANIGMLGNPNRINTDIPVLGAGVGNKFNPTDPNVNPVATGPAPSQDRVRELIGAAGMPPNPGSSSIGMPTYPLNPTGATLDLNTPKKIASKEDQELDAILEQGEWLF